MPPQANWSPQPYTGQYVQQSPIYNPQHLHSDVSWQISDAPYYEYYLPGYATPYPPYLSGGVMHPALYCSNGYDSMGYDTYLRYQSQHLSSADESAASLGSDCRNRRRLSKKRGKEKKYVPTTALSGDYEESGSLLSIKGESRIGANNVYSYILYAQFSRVTVPCRSCCQSCQGSGWFSVHSAAPCCSRCRGTAIGIL
jgi:hypothetical protein